MPVSYDFNLPPTYTTVRLQNLSMAKHTRFLPQVFALAREQYPEWPAERLQNWLAALAGGNENGTKMAVCSTGKLEKSATATLK